MLALHYIILCALSTAAASAAHGGDYGRKGYVVAFHAFAAPLVAPLFWLAFRRGKQAKAELDVIAGRGDLSAIIPAYYFRPLGKLMARVIGYCQATPWPHLQPNGVRTQQELCGGFVIGGILGAFTLPLLFLGGIL